jgi:hypothetical protein
VLKEKNGELGGVGMTEQMGSDNYPGDVFLVDVLHTVVSGEET